MDEEQRQAGVVFRLDGLVLALPLQVVVRVIRAVAVAPLPNAPSVVRGVIDLHGEVVPVVNIRERFGLPDRELACDDHILIAQTPRRPLALPVDQVGEVIDWKEGDLVATETLVPGTKNLKGILKTTDGLILVHDLDALLAIDEETALDEAIRNT